MDRRMVRKLVGMSGKYIGRGICRRRGGNFHGVAGGDGVDMKEMGRMEE